MTLNPPQTLDEARALVDAGHGQLALSWLSDLEGRSPENAEVTYLRGISLLQASEFALSEETLSRFLGKSPESYWGLWNRAVARAGQGKIDAAIQDCLAAALLAPGADGAVRYLMRELLPRSEASPPWLASAVQLALQVARGVEAQVHRAAEQRPDPAERFWKPNLAYENAVRSALLDIVRPGDVVFDVGANIGGLMLAAARATGPTGQVVAFEASARNLPKLMAQVTANGLHNTWVVDRAVYKSDQELLKIYENSAGYSDSLYIGADTPGLPSSEIETITLDTFCRQHGLYPRILKIDVEFAELDVLLGATETLQRPDILILMEVWPQHPAPVELLLEAGFTGCSLESFDVFTTPEAFSQSPIANALFFRSDAAVPQLYRGSRREPALAVSANTPTGASLEYTANLPPGRYVVWVDIPQSIEGAATVQIRSTQALLVDLRWPNGKFSTVPLFLRIDRGADIVISAAFDRPVSAGETVGIRIEKVVPASHD